MTSIKDLPDKLSLNLIADAYAAITDNALRHIDVNVRMGVVEQVWFVRAVKVALSQTVVKCVSVKWFLRKLVESFARMILSQHH